MTNEERIDWLCRLRADLNNGIIYTPWNKEFTEALTEVLEQQQKIDEIIKRIEETRDKDKIAEYPYNRCIKIVKDVLENDKL